MVKNQKQCLYIFRFESPRSEGGSDVRNLHWTDSGSYVYFAVSSLFSGLGISFHFDAVNAYEVMGKHLYQQVGLFAFYPYRSWNINGCVNIIRFANDIFWIWLSFLMVSDESGRLP